ncbi:MAG: hypothetical protein VB118_08450 [Oscillospiraceae bacterium]|nr:hypothetical protein [Oscillospiraceae bacterium]
MNKDNYKRAVANLCIVFALTIMTFAVIGYFNSAINILDNPYSRPIILIAGVLSILNSVNCLIDIFKKKFAEARNPEEDEND